MGRVGGGEKRLEATGFHAAGRCLSTPWYHGANDAGAGGVRRTWCPGGTRHRIPAFEAPQWGRGGITLCFPAGRGFGFGLAKARCLLLGFHMEVVQINLNVRFWPALQASGERQAHLSRSAPPSPAADRGPEAKDLKTRTDHHP